LINVSSAPVQLLLMTAASLSDEITVTLTPGNSFAFTN